MLFRSVLARETPGGILKPMPSLDSLVATHRTVLLIDSASAQIQVGLWQRDAEVLWRQSDQEAGIAIFACVAAVLALARIGVADLGALVFCEGPGSILGIRTAAMALRVWSAAADRPRPTYAYRSLELLANDLQSGGVSGAQQAGVGGPGDLPEVAQTSKPALPTTDKCGAAPRPFAVVADARRESWHWVDGPVSGPAGRLRRVPTTELLAFTGEVFAPAGFRTWSQPARPISTIAYSLPVLWARQRGADLLHPAPEPDAFLHEDATYVTWTPQIHRAGVRSPPTRAGA